MQAPVEYSSRSDTAYLKLEVLQFLRDLLQILIQRVRFLLTFRICSLENTILALEIFDCSAEVIEPVRKRRLA